MPKQQYSEGVVKRDGVNWLGVWYVYVQADGVRKRRRRMKVLPPKTMKKDEAREKLRVLVAASRGVKLPTPPADTLAELWTRYCTFKEGNWSKATTDNLKSLFKQNVLPRIGDYGLKAITLDPLQKVLNDMARERSSRSQLTKVRLYLKAVLEYAVDENMIDRNPARGKKLAIPTNGVPKQSERFYSLDEVHMLLSLASGREHLILRLFFVGGFRPGELFALRVNDVRRGEIMVDQALKQSERRENKIGAPKTDESIDTVPIPAGLEQELRMWIEAQCLGQDMFIFPSQRGTPMDPKNYLRRTLRALIAKPGAAFNEQKGDWDREDLLFDLDYRAMRRTCATYFRQNLKGAQRQLRHSTPMTTAQHYQKQIEPEHLAAVEALDAELCPPNPSKTCEPVVDQRTESEAGIGRVN